MQMSSNTAEMVIAVIGGGALSTIISLYYSNKAESRKANQKKDDVAFRILQERVDALESKVSDLESELSDKNSILIEKEQRILYLEAQIERLKFKLVEKGVYSSED